MKNLSYIVTAIAIGTLGLSTFAAAAGYSHGPGYGKGAKSQRFEHRVDRRQTRQRARIGNGVESGNLSRWEAKRLRKDQRKIARMKRRFERDGYYNPRERRALERALDRSSRRIKRANRNDYGPRRGRRYHGWRGHHHTYPEQSYVYDESDDTYLSGSASSTTVSAQMEGFSISWSNSEQN